MLLSIHKHFEFGHCCSIVFQIKFQGGWLFILDDNGFDTFPKSKTASERVGSIIHFSKVESGLSCETRRRKHCGVLIAIRNQRRNYIHSMGRQCCLRLASLLLLLHFLFCYQCFFLWIDDHCQFNAVIHFRSLALKCRQSYKALWKILRSRHVWNNFISKWKLTKLLISNPSTDSDIACCYAWALWWRGKVNCDNPSIPLGANQMLGHHMGMPRCPPPLLHPWLS